MTTTDRPPAAGNPRGNPHRALQRRVAVGAIVFAIVAVIVLIPLMVNPELRLNLARTTGLVTGNTGELVADGDSGATLLVLPTEHAVQGSDRIQLRFLAAFITWPEDGHLRLQPLNGGEDLEIPLNDYDLVSASPDGSMMYIRGASRAALIDVDDTRVVTTLPANAEPDVGWDWRTAVWQEPAYICDRVSNTAAWIGCFPRPTLNTWLAGDWQLNLEKYGDPDVKYEVMRGRGFQPIIGFTADDEWLYVYNSYGIRRFRIPEITG